MKSHKKWSSYSIASFQRLSRIYTNYMGTCTLFMFQVILRTQTLNVYHLKICEIKHVCLELWRKISLYLCAVFWTTVYLWSPSLRIFSISIYPFPKCLGIILTRIYSRSILEEMLLSIRHRLGINILSHSFYIDFFQIQSQSYFIHYN